MRKELKIIDAKLIRLIEAAFESKGYILNRINNELVGSIDDLFIINKNFGVKFFAMHDESETVFFADFWLSDFKIHGCKDYDYNRMQNTEYHINCALDEIYNTYILNDFLDSNGCQLSKGDIVMRSSDSLKKEHCIVQVLGFGYNDQNQPMAYCASNIDKCNVWILCEYLNLHFDEILKPKINK